MLCTALAYLTIHTHQIWPTLVDDITQAFSADIDQAFCLLQVLKYMANDCDNESIVIEDSLRQTYYGRLDEAAREKIFKGIFEQWAQNLPALQANPAIDKTKLLRLRNRILDTFESWIRLALPDEVFENLVNDCPHLIEMLFAELDSEEDDNLTTAVNCIVELISLSQKRDRYGAIKQTVISKVGDLQGHVQRVVASGDFERADQFAEIFVELARSHMGQIVDDGSAIVDILLSIFQMEESNCKI